jgi:hypothetical protein
VTRAGSLACLVYAFPAARDVWKENAPSKNLIGSNAPLTARIDASGGEFSCTFQWKEGRKEVNTRRGPLVNAGTESISAVVYKIVSYN